jgi:drug/metabolite transporter (DMT)-like permease
MRSLPHSQAQSRPMSRRSELAGKELLAWGILILLTLVWGSSFILIKKGLGVFTATQVSALRILSAAVFMTPFAISRIRKTEKKHFLLIFLSGFIGSLIPAYLFALAQTRLDSAITGIINAMTPVFVVLIGAMFYKQKINRIMIAGLLLAFSGTAMLMFYAAEGQRVINYFALLVVAATVMYGLNVNILKFNLSKLNAVAISSISLSFMGPVAAVQLFVFTDFVHRMQSGESALLALGYLSLLGIVGTGLALILFNKLIKIATPLFASSVTYLIPVVAVCWGIVDGEQLTIRHFVSMLIIAVGVYLTNKKS